MQPFRRPPGRLPPPPGSVWRRLRSPLTNPAPQCQHGVPPDQRPLLDVPAAPPRSEWIALMPYSHEWVTGKPLRDHKYRVLWWEHPATFLDYLIW